ncbi:putative uncharacterized protein [Bacteroides sp. CAG:598]|nr:putative uncharacterized protein [Bacteroides sp. CAG:598]
MMKKMIHIGQCFLAICLLLFMVSSCIDDGFESPSQGVIDKDGMVNLTINTNVPGLKVTRNVDINGEAIATLWVLAFNENGNMTSRVLATQTNDVQGINGGAGTFSAKVPASTRILHFLANVNMDNFSDQENIGRHENEVVAPLVSSSGNLVYWGRREFASEDELTNFAADSPTNPVLLYRNQALILYDLQTTSDVNLNVNGWAICNQYAYGTVSPFDASAVGVEGDTPYHFELAMYDYVTTLPEAYRIKQRDDDEVATASSVPGDPRYIFENVNAEDDQVYVIMKIKKNGGDWKWYKIMIIDDEKNPYQIIRNHKYTVRITNINEAYGVSSFEAAKTATPANNPWITISDEIPEVANGETVLSIEGETTVVYQEAGTYTIAFNYNGTAKPKVEWLSNEGVAGDISESDVTWNSGTGAGTITLHVNAPAQGRISYATLQIKEASGVLSRRVKVITTEPFSFAPTWISSEIPLLSGEEITVLFEIPDDFPEELLPVDVKFGCDLIDAQTGEPMKVLNEETVYASIPVYHAETGTWETEQVTKDWNYKYVYTAETKGLHRVNFRTILTNLDNVTTASEFHVYMEGCNAKTGQELFGQRDLFFAFQPNSSTSYQNRYRILLEGGDAATKFVTRSITNLNPVYGETISIPFTLGTLRNDDQATSSWSNVNGIAQNTEVWVYYDPTLVSPSGKWLVREGTDCYGNHYGVYEASQANNEVTFTTISPNFDCYIVLSAKSESGYGTYTTDNTPNLGVNQRGYRSASVTVRSTGRLDFNPSLSTDGTSFTPVSDKGEYSIPYGTGQNVWLQIQVPASVQDKAFQFKFGTQYLEPVDMTGWEKWNVSEGSGWTYTFSANETSATGNKTFQFRTTRLASEETLTMASGNYVGFNPLSVSIVNSKLSGKIQLPEGVTFLINEPYIVLERASDGTRIGTFVTIGDVMGKTEADYTLTLRGEYNITETDRINVKWSPVGLSDVYLYSGLLSSILNQGTTISLNKQ